MNRYTGTTQNIVSILAGISTRAAVDGMSVRCSASDTTIAIGASTVIVVVQSELEGESHDRENISMRQTDQANLVRLYQQNQHHQQSKHALNSTGTTGSGAIATKEGSGCRIIVVVISGGPVDTSEPAAVMQTGFVTSVIAGWQPGEEGGHALAALLWGDVDFSASLAVTVYRQNFTRAGPAISNISLANRGYRYLTDPSLELYPFGYGLSYTSWTVTALKCGNCEVSAAKMGSIHVTVDVQNTGDHVSSRPVLLFVQRVNQKLNDGHADHENSQVFLRNGSHAASPVRSSLRESDRDSAAVAGVVWPNKWLVAFNKAKDVKPSQTQTVALTFGAAEMARWVPRSGLGEEAAGRGRRDTGGFVVIPGQYLLTTVDQSGVPVANMTSTLIIS